MKNNTIKLLIAGILLAIASCSKSSTSTTTSPSGTITAFSAIFPAIDTATLWNIASGSKTGGSAKITSSGSMTITGFGTYAGGSYIIQLTDSSSGPGVKSFNLLRSGVDTIISVGNGIEIFPASGGGRGYYWMQIDGGNLPVNSIVRGDFIDSI